MPLYPTSISRRAGNIQRPARPVARSMAPSASQALLAPQGIPLGVALARAKVLPVTARGAAMLGPFWLGFVTGALIGNYLFDWFTGPGGVPVVGIPPNYHLDTQNDPLLLFPFWTHTGGTWWAATGTHGGFDPNVLGGPMPYVDPPDFGLAEQREFNNIPNSGWWITDLYIQDYSVPGQIVDPPSYTPAGGAVVVVPSEEQRSVGGFHDIFPDAVGRWMPSALESRSVGAALARELRSSPWPQGFQTFAQPGGPQRPTEWWPGSAPSPRRQPLFVPWFPGDVDQEWRFDRLRPSEHIDDRRGTIREMYYAEGIYQYDPGDEIPDYSDMVDVKYPSYVTDAPPGYGRIVLGSGPIPYDAAPNVRLEVVAGGGGSSVTTGHGGYKNTGPLKNEKEKKFSTTLNPRNILLRSFNALSEGKDAVDAVYKALPKDVRRKQPRTLQNKIRLIWQNTDRLDYEQAIKNLYIENVKDFYYGQIGRAGARAQQNLHKLGYPASGPTLTTRTSHTGAGRLPEINFPF